MRHGDVSYVDEAGVPVHPEDVPLTPRGREQAEAARDALANVEFDLVVASDLPRTLETAEIVAPRAHVELWPELAEWRGGRLDAIPTEELEAAFVGALQVRDEAQRFLGGESLGEALDRVHPALEQIIRRVEQDLCVVEPPERILPALQGPEYWRVRPEAALLGELGAVPQLLGGDAHPVEALGKIDGRGVVNRRT